MQRMITASGEVLYVEQSTKIIHLFGCPDCPSDAKLMQKKNLKNYTGCPTCGTQDSK